MVGDENAESDEMTFDCVEVSVVQRVRHWLGSKLREVDQEHREVVLLVGTELVTNVYEHAPGRSSVWLGRSRAPCSVRIEVRDSSTAPPRVGSSDKGSLGGRGMVLVDTLADAWGVDRTEHGKAVWARVSCGQSRSAVARCYGES